VTKQELNAEDIAYVCELTIKAGALAKQMREGVSISEKTAPEDKVTAADFALSRMIVSALSERFTDDVIVSEEDEKHPVSEAKDRVWLIDPIDGTENYISNDGQWAVMIGLIVRGVPVFGFVYAPATKTLYYGGPGFGTWRCRDIDSEPSRIEPLMPISTENDARVTMGGRDRRSHPWVKQHPKVTLVKAGSIGLKVAKVLEGEADIFVHLSCALKTWDTAGPAAIALGAQLDVGTLDSDSLMFDTSKVRQEFAIVMGRPGSLVWSRLYLRQPDKVHCENGANN
jgi:3'(2'), 5'-bisphosphate nucleotidase